MKYALNVSSSRRKSRKVGAVGQTWCGGRGLGQAARPGDALLPLPTPTHQQQHAPPLWAGVLQAAPGSGGGLGGVICAG